MDDIKAILKRFTDAEEIRLLAGEIDPETMRTVLAVTRGMARQIRKAAADRDAYVREFLIYKPLAKMPLDRESGMEVDRCVFCKANIQYYNTHKNSCPWEKLRAGLE